MAAVSVGFPILFLVLSLGAGLTVAGTVVVSQYKGAGNQRQVDYSASQTLLVITILSVFLAMVGYFGAAPLMQLVGAGPEIYTDSVDYFQVSSFGFVFLFIFFVFLSLMRGIGNVWFPSYVILFTVFLNLVLDPLFIFGWGPVPAFGVSGAAVASVFTQAISAVIAIVVMARGKKGIKISLADMKPDFSWTKRILALGIPVSLEQSTRAGVMTVMVMLVTGFGSEVVAAYGIGSRVLSLVVVPALGLGIATTTLVGQNVGAGKLQRAEKAGNVSAKFAFISLTATGLLLFVFAENLTAFFVPNDPKVIKDGALFIRIMAPSFGLLGVQQVLNGTFNGAGFTQASMLISIFALWMVRFPLAYVLSEKTTLGHEGIWWAFPISNAVGAIAAFIYYKMGHWKVKAAQSHRAQRIDIK